MRSSKGRARAVLRERLEARREEIEAAALTRVVAISDPAEVSDPAYAQGLRAAVAAAIDYGIQTTGREGPDPPIPVALLAQARMAARAGIPLDTILRRYFSGYSLLGYFILEEAGAAGLTDGDELKRLLGAHAGLFDRLLAAVGEEHGRETEALRPSAERRRAERIERLLAGEPIDASEIPYAFECWHLGLVAEGPGAERLLRRLAAGIECRLLTVPREGEALWAWLGTRDRLDPGELLGSPALAGSGAERGAALALGEPGEGLEGWRLTHRQAAAVLPVALGARGVPVRYADSALLASIAKDEMLVVSLQELFLEPLRSERDGGETARRTLRAYFAAGQSVSSAAAALGVKRHTVTRRLRAIEQRIDRPIATCAAELEAALRLEELEA